MSNKLKILIFGVILFLFIIFWKVDEQPETISLGYFSIPHSFTTYHPLGAEFSIEGYLIYSAGFRLLGYLYFFSAVIYAIYAYRSVELVVIDNMVERAHKLWLVAMYGFLLSLISILPGFTVGLPTLVLVIAVIPLIAYITLIIPEFILISQSQIMRARSLYKLADLNNNQSNRKKSVINLIRYLDTLTSNSNNHLE